jgi:hypothetical protein
VWEVSIRRRCEGAGDRERRSRKSEAAGEAGEKGVQMFLLVLVCFWTEAGPETSFALPYRGGRVAECGVSSPGISEAKQRLIT